MRPVIAIRGLTKTYAGGFEALKGVDLEIRQGEIFGLLGPNGAGKTTTFKMTVGLINPNSGTVFLHEQDITQLPMYKRARKGMGYLSQEPSIFQQMTVLENIKAILEANGYPGKALKDKALELLGELGLIRLAGNRASRWRTWSGVTVCTYPGPGSCTTTRNPLARSCGSCQSSGGW